MPETLNPTPYLRPQLHEEVAGNLPVGTGFLSGNCLFGALGSLTEIRVYGLGFRFGGKTGARPKNLYDGGRETLNVECGPWCQAMLAKKRPGPGWELYGFRV